MKYLHSWVNEFLAKDGRSLQETVEALEKLGLSVEGVTHFRPTFSGVVIGEVLEAAKHPNADRLSLTKVSDGSAVFDVVCGAPNVRAGQRIAFAPIGAALETPKGRLVIKKASIRNVESNGMICSSSELGLDNEHEGILVLPQEWPLGKPLSQFIGEDAVLDLELPFHRWDLTSHLGLARELSIYWSRERAKPLEHGLDPVPIEGLASLTSKPNVSILPEAQEACRRYMGALMESVKVAKSPFWMSRRLKLLGLKSINNVVDATNYVLLETGQPLHAFDWSKIEGGKIQVRWAKEGEPFSALDGSEHKLSSTDLVIADAEKPVALAGVIGGEYSKVTEDTKNIFIECAWFSRKFVRKTARRLNLRTDSSQRFEKETDIAGLSQVFNRACFLIEELASARLADKMDLYPNPASSVSVEFHPKEAASILGFDADSEEMLKIMRPMCEEIQKLSADAWRCVPAGWRSDLRIPEDFVEEILRHAGTNRVPGAKEHPARVSLPRVRPTVYDDKLKAMEMGAAMREFFQGTGFCEVMNYPLVGAQEAEKLLGPEFVEKALKVSNPVSADLNIMRPGLFAGLYRSWERNFARGHRFIRLQETGDVFDAGERLQGTVFWGALGFGASQKVPHWSSKENGWLGFWSMLGLLESFFKRLEISVSRRIPDRSHAKAFHPNRQIEFWSGGRMIAFTAEIATREMLEASPQHPGAYAKADLSALAACVAELPPKRYKGVPVLPRIHRDLSFVVPRELSWEAMESCVRKSVGNVLESVYPFDIFMKNPEDKTKSVAFRVVLSQGDRTFSHEEIQGFMNGISEKLEAETGAKLRA